VAAWQQLMVATNNRHLSTQWWYDWWKTNLVTQYT